MDKKDDTATIKAKTSAPVTRPPTKAVAPRLSTTSRTSTTSSVTKTALGSSLSKPPTRPSTISSSVRKPPVPSTPSTGIHKKRESDGTGDEKPSGDEKSKDGISARPKRMSLAPSTSATKSVTVTPARRTTIQPSTTSRLSATSPVGAKKVGATPSTARATAGTTARNRSFISSSSKPLGANTVAEKKRLSTIPASPLVKSNAEESDDDKENATSEATLRIPVPVRPALGSRKSTRSVLIEQRVREFELVNSMLQAAMTADGIDEEEQQLLDQEAANTIAKLKSDLFKVRGFERSHGRVPTAAELDEMHSVAGEEIPELEDEADAQLLDEVQNASLAEMRKELAQSRAQAEAFETELTELKIKLEQFSQSAEEEAGRVQEAAEAIRKEHAAKIDELASIHDARIQDVQTAHQEHVEKLSDEHVAKTEQLSGHLTTVKESAAQSKSELEVLRKVAAERASAADSYSEMKNTLETKIGSLELQLRSQAAESQRKVEHAESEIANKQKEVTQQQQQLAKANKELSRQTQAVQSLKEEALSLEQAKKDENGAQSAVVKQLESRINTLEGEKADSSATATSALAEVKKTHTVEIESVKRQLEEAHEAIKRAQDTQGTELAKLLKKSDSDIAAANAELESAKTSNSGKIQELEGQLRKAREVAETKATGHQTTLGDLHVQLVAVNSALDEANARHEKALKDHEAHAKSTQEELANLKAEHDKKIADLQSASQSKREEEISLLKTNHNQQVLQFEEKLQVSQKDMSTLKKTHATQIKQLENQMSASLKDLGVIEAVQLEQIDRIKAEGVELQRLAIEEAEKVHIERVRKLEQQLHATETKMGELISAHTSQLEDLERRQTSEQEATLTSLKKSHTAAIQDLEDQLRLAEDSMETVKIEHAEQLKQLEEQTSSRHGQAIDKLRQDHAKKLEHAETKANSGHEEALDDLRATHAEQSRQLESQTRSLQQELQVARQQAKMMKGILQDTEGKSQAKEAELSDEVEKLRADMSTSVLKLAQVSAVQARHDEVVAAKAALETKSQEDMDALRADHGKALAEQRRDLEKQHKDAVVEIQASHAESIKSSQSAHESKYDEIRRQMKEDHDNQLDEIMKTLEGQWKSQVEQLEEQNAAASVRLAEVETSHEKAMQTLESGHDAALGKLLAELEGVREAAEAAQASPELEQLRSQLVQAQEQAKELSKKHDAIVEEDQTALAKLKKELAAAHQLGKEQQDDVKELEQKHAQALTVAVQEKGSAVAALQKELTEAKEALTKQETLAKALKGKHSKALSLATDDRDSALAKINEELSEAKEATAQQLERSKELEEQHNKAMDAAIQKHEKALASVEQELLTTRKARANSDNSKVEELNKKYLDAQNELAALQDKHDQATRHAQAEYDSRLEKVLMELSLAKKSSEKVPKPAEVDEVKKSLDHAHKTITSLETELEGAMLEIETQRNLADSAKKEVDELKAHAIALPSPKTRRRKSSPKRKSMNPLSSTESKSGLESSKWASPTGEAPALRGGGEDDDASTTKEDTPAPNTTERSRNVAGQLAGIHEQIKQLDEMSEDFLEDHQKMASILSRVDDETETNLVEVEEEEEAEKAA